MARSRRLVLWLLAAIACFVAGELAARLDDWIFQDVPILADPDRERDLILHDADGVRGRPNGRYKKYKLNQFGFRGPEIAKEKSPDTIRVMVLGASETFGLYESVGHEFPALLAKALANETIAGKKIEVINAAVAGMALPTLTEYWKKWASQFKPDIVLIYPSPQFYLDNEPPKALAPRDEERPERLQSRLLERLKDTAKQSALIRAIRVRYLLWRESANRDDKWFFRDVPNDRLNLFFNDLEELGHEVEESGAVPVLVTHAFKYGPGDQGADLEAFRIFFPRSTATVIAQFDAKASRVINVGIRRANHWMVIDASRQLSGQQRLFADPVHYNDDGSRELANILADQLKPLLNRVGENR